MVSPYLSAIHRKSPVAEKLRGFFVSAGLSNQQILSPEPEVEKSIIGCESTDAGSYVTLGVCLQLCFKSLLILTCVPDIHRNQD
jgi:hypothetical protein